MKKHRFILRGLGPLAGPSSAAMAALLLCASALAATPAAEPPREDAPRWEKLQGIVAALPKITSLRAKFRQERTSALLAEPSVSTGTFAARAVASRWDTQGDHPSVMAVDAGDGQRHGTLKVWYPAQKTLEIYPLDARFAAAMAGPSPDLALLAEHFTLEKLEADDQAQTLALELVPRQAGLRAHVDKVMAQMDAKTGCLKRLATFDPEGESTTASFSDVQVNPEVKDEELRLEAPADAKTVWPAGKPKEETAKEASK